jgi:hypothetical protein
MQFSVQRGIQLPPLDAGRTLLRRPARSFFPFFQRQTFAASIKPSHLAINLDCLLGDRIVGRRLPRMQQGS